MWACRRSFVKVMSAVVGDTPAVVIKQGQLTLGLLCVLTAAA